MNEGNGEIIQLIRRWPPETRTTWIKEVIKDAEEMEINWREEMGPEDSKGFRERDKCRRRA